MHTQCVCHSQSLFRTHLSHLFFAVCILAGRRAKRRARGSDRSRGGGGGPAGGVQSESGVESAGRRPPRIGVTAASLLRSPTSPRHGTAAYALMGPPFPNRQLVADVTLVFTSAGLSLPVSMCIHLWHLN